MTGSNNKIQFRGKEEKEASQFVSEMRLGGINISELAREGLKEKLREVLSTEERVQIHQQYLAGEVSEQIAQILIGDLLEEIEQERKSVREAENLDTDGFFQEN